MAQSAESKNLCSCTQTRIFILSKNSSFYFAAKTAFKKRAELQGIFSVHYRVLRILLGRLGCSLILPLEEVSSLASSHHIWPSKADLARPPPSISPAESSMPYNRDWVRTLTSSQYNHNVTSQTFKFNPGLTCKLEIQYAYCFICFMCQ